MPPKPAPLSLPDASPNPLSPSSPSTPISRNSASSRTASWLTSAPSTPSPESTLQALSSSPLHRLSHYVSMLSALLSLTPASHPDHAALTSALATIGSIQSQLVSVLTEAENAHRMQQLQSRFVGGGGKDWVREGEEQRWMLQEGSAVRVKEGGGGSLPVHLHLLSDALLVSEETAKGYRLLRWLSLKETQVIDQGRSGAGAGDGGEWRMQLISSSSKPLLLGLASDAVKADWLRGIKAAVKLVCEGGKKKTRGAEAAAVSPLAAAAGAAGGSAVSAGVTHSSSATQLAAGEKEETRDREPEAEVDASEAVKASEDEEKQKTEDEAAESSSEQQEEPHIIAVRAT